MKQFVREQLLSLNLKLNTIISILETLVPPKIDKVPDKIEVMPAVVAEEKPVEKTEIPTVKQSLYKTRYAGNNKNLPLFQEVPKFDWPYGHIPAKDTRYHLEFIEEKNIIQESLRYYYKAQASAANKSYGINMEYISMFAYATKLSRIIYNAIKDEDKKFYSPLYGRNMSTRPMFLILKDYPGLSFKLTQSTLSSVLSGRAHVLSNRSQTVGSLLKIYKLESLVLLFERYIKEKL